MKLRNSPILMAVALAATLVILPGNPARCQSPEEILRIESAAPSRATAKPRQSRKVLVLSRAEGYAHSSVSYGEKAIELMGRKTGAFTTSATCDMDVFRPEILAGFDAIVLNNSSGELFTTTETRSALLAFVRGGKGIVGIHAASDCSTKWPEFGELLGAYFDGHPWTADTTVTVGLDEPGHPVVAAFGGKPFRVQEEIYQFKDPYSRSKLRVLASLDLQKTDMTRAGIKRTDRDFAVAWVRPYGRGRVFYTSLGHNHDLFWTPAVLQHYLDGIQYALGDLTAPEEPRSDVGQKLCP